MMHLTSAILLSIIGFLVIVWPLQATQRTHGRELWVGEESYDADCEGTDCNIDMHGASFVGRGQEIQAEIQAAKLVDHPSRKKGTKIISIEIRRLKLPFNNAYVMSTRAMTHTHLVIVRVHTSDGLVGIGEACPYPTK
mmetsp:Transcript_42625/g.106446  ORF Transcript_42625/g.106446 Transcript_42625/m.106446 type:complete len:138 (-) Transcript_42625:255-668(-)